MVHPLLVTTAIAALDALLGEEMVLIGFLALGPLVASALVGPRETALVSVYAIALAVGLGGVDGMWGDADHMLRVGLVAVASAVSVVLADLREARESSAELLGAEHAAARVLAESHTRRDATRRLLESIGTSLDFDLAAMWTIKDDTMQCADFWRRAGLTDTREFEESSRRAAFHRGVGLPGRVWEADGAVWVNNFEDDPSLPRAPLAARAGLITGLGFPVRGSRGLVGMIELHARDWIAEDPDMLATLDGVGTRIGQYIERRLAEEAVHQSEARKAAILGSSLDCIVTIDHEGRVVEWNAAAERTFGYTAEEAVGAELAELVIPPELRERHRNGLNRYLSTGEGPILDRRVEMTAIRKDGSRFPVELAVTPIRLQGPPMFTGFIRDITQRKETEGERESLLDLERTAREAAEAAERNAHFLAEASALLDESLDYDTTLRRLAELAVPHVADLCAVDVLDEAGGVQHVGLAHTNPAKLALAQRVRDEYPAQTLDPEGIGRALRTGESLMYEELPDEVLRVLARGPEHLEVLRALGIRSAIVVPMRARGRTLGSILLVASEGERRFDDEDLRLAEELARRAAVAVDNARLYSERSYIARTLQESLLPPLLPAVPGIDAAARYHAAGEGYDVGGDFYDLFPTGDGRWSVVIGDVCGKGADAAAVTALARYTLRAAAMQAGTPSQILQILNDAMLSQLRDNRFCTVLYAELCLTTGGAEVHLASGGHPLPLVLSARGEVREAGEHGTLIGVIDSPQLRDRRVVLAPGDALVLFTDGVSDATTPRDGRSPSALTGILSECAGLPASEIAAQLETAAVAAEGGRLRDDVALIVLRVPPDGGG